MESNKEGHEYFLKEMAKFDKIADQQGIKLKSTKQYMDEFHVMTFRPQQPDRTRSIKRPET